MQPFARFFGEIRTTEVGGSAVGILSSGHLIDVVPYMCYLYEHQRKVKGVPECPQRMRLRPDKAFPASVAERSLTLASALGRARSFFGRFRP
jgi:hypothetical protein